MRRLRSAQLGKSINVAQTTEPLELALPELDVELLAGVGGKLDELESLRGELAALQEAEAAAGRFVERYREFARGVVAREPGAADDIVRAARRESRKEQRLAGERRHAADALAQVKRDIARVDEQIAHVQGELRASAGAGSRKSAPPGRGRPAGRARPPRAGTGSPSCATRRPCSPPSSRRRGRSWPAPSASSMGWRRAARSMHGRRPRRPVPAAAARGRGGAVGPARRTRRVALRRLAELHAAAASARAEAQRQSSALDTAEAAERELCARRDELDEAHDRLAEAIDAWAAGLVELRLEPGERDVDEAVLRATRHLAALEEQCSARCRQLAVLRAVLEAEQSDLHADLDPPPPLALWRDAAQPGAPVAPVRLRLRARGRGAGWAGTRAGGVRSARREAGRGRRAAGRPARHRGCAALRFNDAEPQCGTPHRSGRFEHRRGGGRRGREARRRRAGSRRGRERRGRVACRRRAGSRRGRGPRDRGARRRRPHPRRRALRPRRASSRAGGHLRARRRCPRTARRRPRRDLRARPAARQGRGRSCALQLRPFEGAPVAAVHGRWWEDQRRKERVELHAITGGSKSHAA